MKVASLLKFVVRDLLFSPEGALVFAHRMSSLHLGGSPSIRLLKTLRYLKLEVRNSQRAGIDRTPDQGTVTFGLNHLVA